MSETRNKSKAKLVQTRKAIKRIKQPSLRRDFTNMLAGVEFSLSRRQKKLTPLCARALLGMTIGLHRTISPAVAVCILEGLLADSKHSAVLASALNDVDTHDDMTCVVRTGTKIGTCQTAKNATCYTITGAEGCGSLSGFSFPWPVEYKSTD